MTGQSIPTTIKVSSDGIPEVTVKIEHATQSVSREHTVHRTINFVDQTTGKQIAEPVVQSFTFNDVWPEIP